MYRTPEYQHLLLAERALAKEIENPTEESNLSTLATSLCRVIDQKRVMRCQPAPKPVDVSIPRKRSRPVIDVQPYTPLVVDAPSPVAGESKPS